MVTPATLARRWISDCRDRLCVVTGSTGGIGLETARLLAAEGARVVTSRPAAKRRAIGEALHVVADLSRAGRAGARRRAAVAALGGARRAREQRRLARPGALRGRAGRGVGRDVAAERHELRAHDPRRAPACAQRGGGVIVNVSSTAGKRPSTSMPHYSVTKAAVLSLSRLVADLYAKDGIRCNAVTPGPTATEAWLGEGGLADQQGGSRDEVLAEGRRRPAARPARRAGGDRGGDRRSSAPTAPSTSPAPPGAPTAAPSRSSSEPRRAASRARVRAPMSARDLSGTVPGRVWQDVSAGKSSDDFSTAAHGCRAELRDPRAGYPDLMPELAGRVADAFEARIREHEERALSPLAVRSYETRGRARDGGRVRRPHAVPARPRPDRPLEAVPPAEGQDAGLHRPAGDHYRTRMTHTLETTGDLARRRAGAAAERGSVEAIGLGHDMGHTPFGHAGEERARRGAAGALRPRLPHNEQSLRIAERLNLTAEVCDGILTHTGQREPATLEGKIVRIVDRVAYINHDIDDAIRYGLLTEDDLPRAEIELLGPTGSQPDRHARARPRRDAPSAPATSGRARRSARRCSRFARSCSSASTSAEHARASTCARTTTIAAIFDHLVERGDSAGRDRRLRRRHDRPLRPVSTLSALMARIKETPSRRSRPRPTWSRSSPAVRRCGRPAAATGPLPLPRGADAELLRQPGRQALPLLRLRQGRRRDHVRPRDREPRLRRGGRVAGRPVPRQARVRGDLAAARGRRASARDRLHAAARPGGLVLRAPPLGDGGAARRCATTSRAAASAKRSAASSGSASRRGSGARAEGAAEGLHARRAARRRATSTRAATTTSRRA